MPPIDPNAPQSSPAAQPQTPPAVNPPPVASAVLEPAPVVPPAQVSPQPPAAVVPAISPQPVVAPVVGTSAPTPPPPIVPPQPPVPTPQSIPTPPVPESTAPQPEPIITPQLPEQVATVPPQPIAPISAAAYAQSPTNSTAGSQVAPQASEPLAPLAAESTPSQISPPYGVEATQGGSALTAPLETPVNLGQGIPSVASPDTPKSHKKLFLIIGITVAVLALAGGAWAFAGMPGLNKTPSSSSTDQGIGESGAGDATSFNPDAVSDGGKGASTTTGSNSATNPAKPVVFGMVSRPCFSFSLPTPNTASKESTCKVDAAFGNPSTSKILILPSTATFSSLESALAIAKQTYKLASPVDKKIKVGGLDAYEITYTTASGKKAVKIIVGAVGRNYSFGAAKISGFEINLPATTSADLAIVAELIKTWTWK